MAQLEVEGKVFEVDGDGLVTDDTDFAGQSVAIAQHVAAPRQGHGLELKSRPLFAFSWLRISRHTGPGG